MRTIASICSGGGILEQGAIAAGLKPIWGVEINSKVGELYKLNYPDSQLLIQDACKVNWADLPSPDILHASPSCRHFSVAGKKQEHPEDIAVGKAIGNAIATIKPKVFTLENAAPYIKSQSWAAIERSLLAHNYKLRATNYNFNRWGIPQKKRIRMIVVATRDTEPPIITIPNRTKWWYKEIQDLIPTLKRSPGLTGTQKKYLSDQTKAAIARGEAVILKRNQIGNYTPAGHQNEPYCWTVTATLATDQRGGDRSLFGDLVTPDGIFSLNTRVLARIQTVPDTYKLTGVVGVDGLAIGDGVSSYFAEQLFKQIIYSTRVQLNIYDALNSDPQKDIKKIISNESDRNLPNQQVIDRLFPKKKSDEQINYRNCGNLLTELEETVKKYSGNDAEFYLLAKALQQIKEDKLYKEVGYKSFIAYCGDRFNLGRSYVNDLIKAIPIYESINDAVQLQITESHCRELRKIKDPEVRSQVLTKVAQGKITAKAIHQTYRKMVVNAIADKEPPNLPPINSIIKLTTKYNHELTSVDGYWGVITDVLELTCEASVLGRKQVQLNTQDFMVTEQDNEVFKGFAIGYLARLNKIYNHPKVNRLVKLTVENLARDVPQYPDKLTEDLLLAIEQSLSEVMRSQSSKETVKLFPSTY